MLRIAPQLHAVLRRNAARGGVSLNAYCQSILAAAVRDDRGEAGPVSARLLASVDAEFSAILEGVVLFGSRARGEHTESSDVDLLIAVRGSATVSRELYQRWDGAVGGQQVNGNLVSPHFARLPAVVDVEIGSLWLEVALHGVILLDRTGRVTPTLAGVRDLVASGGLQRRTAHGHPYWIKQQPDA